VGTLRQQGIDHYLHAWERDGGVVWDEINHLTIW
jgi:hypothetical protein